MPLEDVDGPDGAGWDGNREKPEGWLAWIEADDVDCQCAADAGQAAAERECDGEHQLDIDAEALRHALVIHRGTHLGTEARALQCHDQQ